jgi:hypothetical protein
MSAAGLVAERAALVARTSIVTGVVEPISGCRVAWVLPAAKSWKSWTLILRRRGPW